MKFFYLFCLLLSINILSVFGQQSPIQKICPPHWWIGMENESLQLLVHGENIANSEVSIKDKSIRLQTQKVENPNYIFLDLTIPKTTKSGMLPITFKLNGNEFVQEYELKKRQPLWKKQGEENKKKLNSSDFIYLIMPDRFSSGESDNDKIEGMNEISLNRKEMYDRHGGDLQGVINHLDYLEELGVTALWLNPVITNDQPKASYHGYAATDHYSIDPRFGDMEIYLELVEECHKRGIKMVMDVIHNHIGNEHWLFKDLPAKDWVHEWDGFTRTNYRAPTLFDPYAADYDKDRMLNGWFDHHMPDLNQSNEFVANYIIQNNIWWIEHGQTDAFRMDTYTYSDPDFLIKWGDAIFQEYPDFGMFGETWVHGTPTQAYFHGNTTLQKEFKNKMPGLTDFQMHYAIHKALTENFGWTEGVSRLYYTLAKDFLYEDPYNNVLFLDNHDASRFYSVVGEDFKKYKMGLALLMTLRGIPCMYYGTEILMKNFSDPDGKVREDFPGGWDGDTMSKFTKEGRTEKENEAFEYVKLLSNYRKNNPVLHDGKLMQFVPYDGVYTFFRYSKTQSVMIVVNSNDKEIDLDTTPFEERTKGFKSAKNIVTNEMLSDFKTINVPAHTTLILELQR